MSYGKFSQFLHRLALNSDLRCEVMFDIERSLHRKKLEYADNHVFVCGLARAGTTITMRSLHETSEFSSLTYRDMPFSLMPNLWRAMSASGQRQIEETERAHGDGIKVDFDSPEALEEVFWRVFSGDGYIGQDELCQHDVEADVTDRFTDYVALVNLCHGRSRYLSKNNNNILRVDALTRAFPASHILIPFRDPLAQSASLQRQHQLFLKRHDEDAFSRRYMNWLVHHEFGADQKSFRLRDDDSVPRVTDRSSLRYWLTQWLSVYRSLLEQYSERSNVIFVCYEDLCAPTLGRAVWQKLSSVLDIPIGHTEFRASVQSAGNTDVEDLVSEGLILYGQMRAKAAVRLGYSAE